MSSSISTYVHCIFHEIFFCDVRGGDEESYHTSSLLPLLYLTSDTRFGDFVLII